MHSVSEKEFEAKTKVKPEQPEEKEGDDIRVPSDSGTIVIDLEKFIKFASIRKELQIGEIKLVMKTLTQDERSEAIDNIKVAPDESLASYLEKIKKPLLSYSIISVDGSVFSTKEHRAILMNYLSKAQGAIVDRVWEEYEKLLEEQKEVLSSEELKKK